MAEIILAQSEADALIAMEKQRIDETEWEYPDLGGRVNIPLISLDKRETFFLDLERSTINLSKRKHQNRARGVVVLVRLDIGGAPHRNPDGQEMPCPHIHLYKEGFGDKWAYHLPTGIFSDIGSNWQTLLDFMGYCNITLPPRIGRSFFT